MTLVLSDRVKETTVTTGTGSVTLAGAFGGFQTFSSAIGDANSTYYVLENDTRFEVGVGTYDSDTNSLSRDTVLKSSSGGSKISLDGLTTVFCTYPADKAIFLDATNRLSLKDTNASISGVNAAHINSDGDLGVSGLLTLRRTSAGNFFHAYVDDSNDRTISLFHDATVSPDWKLGLKNSPSNSGEAPSYAYVYAGDGSIGLYSNSQNSINLTHGGGFNIVNKSNTVFTSYSDEGTQVNSFSTSNPSFTVKATSAQSADLQRWVTSSETVMAKVSNDGSITANSITATGDLLVGGTNIISHVAQNTASGVAISGWAKYYADSQDHSGVEVSGALQPQITKNTADLLVVSGISAVSVDAIPHTSGDYFLTEIRANSASGSVNAADILVVSGIVGAGGLPSASGGNITANTNLIHSSGNFLLDKISASGASVSGLANTAIVAVSGYAEGYADVKITNLINGAPAALDTLHEIADSLNDNTDLAGSLTTSITNNTTSIDNLNIFDEVRVAGQDNVVATTNSDILTFAAGDNVTITTSAASDTITIAAASADDRVHASGNFLLDEVRANSASGLSNQTALNGSGNILLAEIVANSASGATNAANITVVSGIASAGGSSLPQSSGDFFLTEIRTNSSSGNFNLAEIRSNSASGAANLTEIRANSASGVVNANAINNSGVFWLGEIQTNSASGAANLTEIRANSASGAANLTEIRANSASGVTNASAINNSGVYWLGEIRSNSASGNFNLTEIRANSASGTANLTEIRANSASGNANLTEIRANSASGAVNAGLINNSGVFWLGEIAANSASGAANLTEIRANSASGNFNLTEIRANSASGNFSAGSGIELHGKAFQVAVSGANLLATNTPTNNYVPSYDIDTGTFTWVENAGGGGGGGSMTSVKSNGSAVGGSDIVTLDFSSDFGVAETPDTEINITIGTLNQNTTGSAATLTTARAIALAGDVTGTANFDGSAGISITSTIADDAVTYAKMQNVTATNVVLGRDSAGAGIVEEISAANLRTIINVEDGADVTDTTNVTSAGALMDSEVTNLAFVKALAKGISDGNVLTANDAVADDDFLRINGTEVEGLTVAEVLTALNVEAAADVTDTANVTTAGALMDSELTDLAGVKGVTISTLQVKPSEGAFANGDKTKLDGIAASANNYTLPSASTTAVGGVELATTAETTTGTDTARAVTPDGLKDGYQGSTNVTTLGTIATGAWQGTAIAHAYIGADAIDGDNIADDAVNSEHYVDGSIDTAHIGNDQVTYAKVQNVSATSRVLGRITSGAGVIEELTGANIISIIGTLNQDTTGSAATLTTARNINGVAFDGSAPITVTAAGSTLSDTVPVSKGGTGATSFADKAVLITQDTGTDTVAAVAMSTNGQLLIGGTSGPAVATLTAGSNVTITNADGAITIAAAGGGGSSRSVAGDTDNGVMTWVTSDNTFAAEANLTFDGSTLTLAGVADITDTTDASDATGDTGALRCEGGASIAKKLYVGTDLDVDGTTNLDAVDIDGAVDLTGQLKLTGAFVPGAGINAQTETTSITLDCSEGNYFEVTLTNGQTPVATVKLTNATAGQRIMVRVIQPSNGNIVLDSVADGWDAISINSGTGSQAAVACKWGGGIGPILTTGNGAADLYGFIVRGVDGSAAIDGVIIAQGLAAT